MIEVPNKNDVLLGRGPHCNEHPGNQQFRELVQEQKQNYLNAGKRREKRAIAVGIIERISKLDPPGRFLKQCSAVAAVAAVSSGSSGSGADGVGGAKEGEGADGGCGNQWICADEETALEKVLHRLREKEKTKTTGVAADGTKSLSAASSAASSGEGEIALPQLFGNNPGRVSGALNEARESDPKSRTASATVSSTAISSPALSGKQGQQDVIHVGKDVPQSHIEGGGMDGTDPSSGPLPLSDENQNNAAGTGELELHQSLLDFLSCHLGEDDCNAQENIQFERNNDLAESTGRGTSLREAIDTSSSGPFDRNSPAHSLDCNVGVRATGSTGAASSVQHHQDTQHHIQKVPTQQRGVRSAIEIKNNSNGFGCESKSLEAIDSDIGANEIEITTVTTTTTTTTIRRKKQEPPPLCDDDVQKQRQNEHQQVWMPTERAQYNPSTTLATAEKVTDAFSPMVLAPPPVVDNAKPMHQQAIATLVDNGQNTIVLNEWIQIASRCFNPPSVRSQSASLGGGHDYLQMYLPMAVDIARKLVKCLIDCRDSGLLRGYANPVELTPSSLAPLLDSSSVSLKFTAVGSGASGDKDFFKQGRIVDSVSVIKLNEGILLTTKDDTCLILPLCNIFIELFTVGRVSGRDIFVPSSSKNGDEQKIDNQFQARLNLADESADAYGESFSTKSRKMNEKGELFALQSFGVPMSLCRLISDMRDQAGRSDSVGNDTPMPMALNDVLEDLSQMVEDSDRYLYDLNLSSPYLNISQLCVVPQFRVKGREKELDTLVLAAKRTKEVGSSVVWVSGKSGVGKTSLVHQFRQRLSKIFPCASGTQIGVPKLSCKFDMMKQANPFGNVASAFENYFSGLLSGDNCLFLADVVKTVETCLGRSIITLCDLVPSFGRIYSSLPNSGFESSRRFSSPALIGSGDGAKARIHFIFSKILYAISLHSGHPIIFTLDDCQWADEPSLELLPALVHEFTSRESLGTAGILIVGCHRNDPLELAAPLSKCKRTLEMDLVLGTAVTNIHLENLSRNDVNHTLSDALCLTARVTRPLSNILFFKTLGNPFALVHYVQALTNEKLLIFSLDEKRWIWNATNIQKRPIDDSIARHFASMIHHLPQRTKTALKIMACFGASTDEKVLSTVGVAEMSLALNEAIREGFVLKFDRCFKFCHDAVQEAAYSLIPIGYRSKFHKILADRLKSQVTADSSIIFYVLDQVNRVDRAMLTGSQERREYCFLYLDAAQKSVEFSAFNSALQYIKAGVDLLESGHWQKDYALSKQFFDIASHVCYLEGRLGEMHNYLNEMLRSATCFLDKLEAFYLLALSLSTAGDLNEAFKCVVDVLDQLGEHFSQNVDGDVIKDSITVAVVTLKNVGEDHFDYLPVMVEKEKLAAMWFLKLALNLSLRMNKKVGVLFASRMVELTMKYGIARESAFGILSFAYNFIYTTLKVEEGYRIGKLALTVLENPVSDNEHACVKTIFYGTIANAIEPIQAISDPLLKAYNDNILLGNPELAGTAAMGYCVFRWVGGVDLKVLSKEHSNFINELARYRQINSMRILLANYHGITAFIELPENPLWTKEEGFSPDQLLQYATTSKDSKLLSHILNNHLRTFAWYGDLDRVEKILVRFEKLRVKVSVANRDPHVSFVQGSCLFRLARHTGESKWYSLGVEHLQVLKQWEPVSKWNWENKVALLEAERHFSDGNYDQAAECYKLSLAAAQRSRFVHFEGYAYELWALMCKKIGNSNGYFEKMKEAHRCYLAWGGEKKAMHILKQIQS